ncbi:unnamed protein product [Chironomus riparius]|uniref:Uncharacterized protein n=1 Tax=Chironomus riparius TaxID=315576 RepID=A0A9N9RYR4_9DIPT|nr:unnamed protein product [Chironomus riparius]
MNKVQHTVTCILIFLSIFPKTCISKLKLHFYKIECAQKNESEYLENIVCKLSKNKVGDNALSVYADIAKNINYVDLNFGILHKSSNKLMINTSFEYCSSYNNMNPFVKAILSFVNNFEKDLFHECPYLPKKKMGIENFPFETMLPMLSIANFQRGDYKMWTYLRDKNCVEIRNIIQKSPKMNKLQFEIVFALFFFGILPKTCYTKLKLHFYKVECPPQNKTEYLENIVCKLSKIKDGENVLTLHVDVVRNINYFDFNFGILHKSSNKLMINTTFEYCSSYNNLNPFIKAMFTFVNTIEKDLFHECPYLPMKKMGVENLPFDGFVPLLSIANFQRVTMFGDLIVELNYMLMNFYLIHKTSHRTLVNVTMEYCSVYGNFPLIVRVAIEFTKKFTNDMIHACPYAPRKKLGVESFPTNELANKALNVFSDRINIERGDYFSAFSVKDRKGIIIFNFKGLVTVSQKRMIQRQSKRV